MRGIKAGLVAAGLLLAMGATTAAVGDVYRVYVFCAGDRIRVSLFASGGDNYGFGSCLLRSFTSDSAARAFVERLGGEGARCSCD